MDMVLDEHAARRWVAAIVAAVESHRDYLTQLDAAIGDADHGVNLQRGFSAVAAALADKPGLTPGQVLLTTGTTLVSKVGGASGPLYGTAFREAGRALGDTVAGTGEQLLAALEAALEGIRRLGSASVGDKTIVDAFSPAVTAFAEALGAGADLAAAAAAAESAADDGMHATVGLQAHKGRASYLGPRSVGHQDPGATSTALIFGALRQALVEQSA